MTTCWTCSGSTSARSSAASMAIAPELRRGQGREAAAELADGSPGGAEDHGAGHCRHSTYSRPAWTSAPPPRRPRRRARTPSRSVSSRMRASRTTRRRRAGRARRIRRGQARLPQARPHARRRQALADRRPRQARRVRSRARQDRRRRRDRPRPRARRALAVLGAPAPRLRRPRRRVRGGQRDGRLRRSRCSRAGDDEDDGAELGELIVSAHHDVAAPVGDRPRRRRVGQPRPRPPEPPRQRPHADARWPSARARSPTSHDTLTLEVMGRARDRGGGHGRVRRRRAGRPRGAAADHAALRRPGRVRPGARLRRQGGHVRLRRHLDQARQQDERHEVRHVGRRRGARAPPPRSRASACRCAWSP